MPSEFSVRRDSTGLGFAVVRNPKPNDASWVQQVTVQPNTWYRLAGHVRAVGVDESSPAGASLSQTDGFERGRVVKGADSGWQRVEMWFKTDPSQRTANIACRLGSYGSLAAGEAWCTGIELTPQGGPPLNADFVFGPVEESTTPVGLPASLLLIGLVGYGLWRYARLPAGVPLRERLTLDGILLALLVAKLVVAPLWQYRIDIGAYSAWAMKLAVEGPARFYAPGYFADYPPGYMYVLWWIGMVAKAFSLGTSSFVTLIKLPAILADLAVSRLIFARLRGAGKRLAWLGAMAFALNPALVLDSAVWGQTDSILALLVLLAFFAQGERRFELAWIFAAVAVLTKPQAMLMVPLLVLWPVGWWKSGRPLLALLATLATVFVIADPFRGDRPWRWLIDLYGGTTGYYSETAVNAMNLQALLFGMRRPDSTILLGLTAQVWGYVIGGLLGLAFFVAYVRRPTRWAHASMFASATLVAFFCLSRMHVRYLYPFFPVAALLGVTGPLGWLYGALSAVFFANEFIVYLFQKDASAGPNWLWMTVSALGVLGMLGWLAAMWRSSTGRLGETSEPAFTGDDDAWVRESAEALATSTAVRETARRVGSATAAAREPAWGWQELLLLALLTLGAAAIRFHDLGTPAEIVSDRDVRRVLESIGHLHEGRFTVRDAGDVDGDEDAREGSHGAGGQVDRHLHGGRTTSFAAPEEREDERRDERELVEEVEADEVVGTEHAERAAEHEQDQAEVGVTSFDLLVEGLDARGEADERGHREERRAKAVEREAEAPEADGLELLRGGGRIAPEDEQPRTEHGRDGEAAEGEARGEAARKVAAGEQDQADEDRGRDGEREERGRKSVHEISGR